MKTITPSFSAKDLVSLVFCILLMLNANAHFPKRDAAL